MNWRDALSGVPAGLPVGSKGLNHRAYLYDDERDYLACLAEFV